MSKINSILIKLDGELAGLQECEEFSTDEELKNVVETRDLCKKFVGARK